MPQLKNKIPGGKADNQNLNQYCPRQLLMGILVEMEHTDDIATAVEITTDHLEENRKYYSYLEDMESKMENSNKSVKLSASAWQRIANSIGIKVAQDSSEEDILQVIDDLLQETEDSNMRSKLQLMRSYFNNPENLKAAKRAAEGPITEEGGVYTQEPVPVFTIKPEYLEYWGNVPADTQVTDDMVQELSRTWQVSVEDLYNQLQPAQAAQPVTARRRNKMKTATKWFYNNNEVYGDPGPFEAESAEELAEEMIPTFEDWARSDSIDGDSDEIAETVDAMYYDFIKGLEEVEPPSSGKGVPMRRRGEYQGWSNYETWAIALILDNDRGTYEMMQEMREEAESYAKDGGSPALSTALVFSDMLKSFVEEIVEDDLGKVSDFSSQLIHGAIGEVNWREIAENELEK